jgi:hypothetical protein
MSKSSLPNGGFSLTNGSNYMLDGFHFDTEYNNGPFEKARLPEVKGLSVLPSGMIPLDNPITSEIPVGVEADFDLDLSEFTKSATQDISIVDHSWLATQPKPNLEGLRSHEDIIEQFSEGRFEHPEVNQLKALEQAWGTSTTGLDIVPNSQRKHDKYQNNYGSGISSLPGDDYREVREKALRKLAYGKESLQEIVAEIENLLVEKEPEKAEKLASELRQHHGLYGRVYVREKDFPGLFNGRWDEVLNKRCASVQYIISEHEDCVFDRFLGRKVVASVKEIDWKEAYQLLMPKLKSFGVRKASGTHKEILKKAFIDLMAGDLEKYERPQTWWSVQENHFDKMSSEEALRKLATSKVNPIHISTPDEVGEIKTSAKLERIASQLVAEGFLDDEQVEAVLCGCGKTAREKIARLYEISAKPQDVGGYEGYGKEAHVHTPERRQKETEFVSREDLNFKKRLSFVMTRAQALVQTGFVSLKDVESVVSTHKRNPELILKSLFKRASESVKIQVGTYEGIGESSSIQSFSANSDHLFKKEAERVRVVNASTKKAQAQSIQRKVQDLVGMDLISVADVIKVTKKASTNADKLLAVLKHIENTPLKVASYKGTIYNSDERLNESQLAKKQNLFMERQASQSKRAYEAQVQAQVQTMLDNRLITEQDFEQTLKKYATPDARLHALQEIASKPKRIDKSASSLKAKQTAHFMNTTKKTASSTSEARVATWLRQKMTEGVAGKELDALLAGRFAENILNEHQSRIASLREEHEGISGHAYVDATAYVTEGSEGCDKGALIHRANQIPALLNTTKCATCVFNTDGQCQKYNKAIIDNPSLVVGNVQKYQKDMIRLANSSDAERTASLFTNNYDEDEFSLEQDAQIELDESPSHEQLGSILFGGFEV